MRTVVLVTYQFPPLGGKAVQRMSKLARYLPQFGWRPIIFTMPKKYADGPLDRSLLDELPGNLEIHRPSFFDWRRCVPYDVRKYFNAPLPDKYRAWADRASAKLVYLIRNTGADAMITTSPSHSTQLLGLNVKRETDIPWVVDFRDQWMGHPDARKKSHYAQLFDMETDVLVSADAVAGVVPIILNDCSDRVPKDKLHLIENGYDESDFSHIDWKQQARDGALWIGYNGTVSAFHDPAPLLDVVDDMLEHGRLNPASLRLVFTIPESGKKRLLAYTKLIREGVLQVESYRPHAESLTRLASLDVSLLLLTRGRDLYSGKVFEYFRIGNPVLSLSPPGDDLDRLIRETDSGVVVDFQDAGAIEAELKSLMDCKQRGVLPRLDADISLIERFSREGIAGRYARLLNDITNRNDKG